MRSPLQNAVLALLLEVTGTPKPGNVDRHREYEDLRFEHFMAGAAGSIPGLALAADSGVGVGHAFEQSVAGMAEQTAGNTQFGALLMLCPLVRTTVQDELTPEKAARVVEATTVEDACAFYRAFGHVDVAVDHPPSGLEALDVRRGSQAESHLREQGYTLGDVMELSREVDGVAQEWTDGFPRSFAAAEWIENRDGSVTLHDGLPSVALHDGLHSVADRASKAFLRLLAAQPDTFIETQHDRETAERASDMAREALDGQRDPEALADEFVERSINPGTTADLTAAALFIALERGLTV